MLHDYNLGVKGMIMWRAFSLTNCNIFYYKQSFQPSEIEHCNMPTKNQQNYATLSVLYSTCVQTVNTYSDIYKVASDNNA